jgi:hypothetical protein
MPVALPVSTSDCPGRSLGSSFVGNLLINVKVRKSPFRDLPRAGLPRPLWEHHAGQIPNPGSAGCRYSQLPGQRARRARLYARPHTTEACQKSGFLRSRWPYQASS